MSNVISLPGAVKSNIRMAHLANIKMVRPDFQEPPNVKILINIGGGMDIITGSYLKGKYGESILNGGMGMFTAITGGGNSFKSTLMHYMVLSAASKVEEVAPTLIMTYDTEVNIHEGRLFDFTQQHMSFMNRNILSERVWQVTDKTVYSGNKWHLEAKAYLQEKKKSLDDLMVETPFLGRDGKTLLKVPVPTFGEIDSFTEFDTDDIEEIQNKTELGDSAGNTIHMRQGLAKTRMLMEIPTICGGSNHFLALTAHVGKDMNIQAGPVSLPPPKKLSTMRSGDKIKGVTDKLFFLSSNMWQVYDARPFLNKETKGPEYPINQGDNQANDADLFIVTMKLLRSKSAPSGRLLEVLISQTEGVLASLTEYHLIKTAGYYGLGGNKQNHHLEIYPDVNLSRTTVRAKLRNDPMLCRAMQITSEMCQINTYWRHLDPKILCTPAQLYRDLKEQGYDWNELLQTRGYWVFNNDQHPVPFLSTMDLLLLRVGEYQIYWKKPKEQQDVDAPVSVAA